MNGKLFQICGLPRFGSAFMSVLFSLENDCIGLHEQGATDSNWQKSIEDYRNRYKYVADCSTYGYLPKAIVHDSVKVYVKKDAESSAKECTERFGYEVHLPSIQMLREYADKWAASNSVMTIGEGELFKVDTLRRIWVHCFHNERAFPEEKAARLITMNIQRHEPEKVFSIENGNRFAKEVF
jgi:hypothetical protein